MKWRYSVSLVVAAVCLGTGCRIVSPLLLEIPSARTPDDAMPLAIGVSEITKAGPQRMSHVQSYYSLGFFGMGARMPRRSEPDYLNKSLTAALRADGLFKYVYATPFDRDDVDLVLTFDVQKATLKNSAYGTIVNHLQMVPAVGFLVGLGQLVTLVPQEHFSIEWDITCTVTDRSGKALKTYTHRCRDRDFVNLWEQPFGNYMWYESVFLKHFRDACDTFAAGMNEDRAELLRAARGS